MDSFIWNSSFVTGLSDVDHQHQHLVDLINRFGELLVENELVVENVETVYNELADYAAHHFRDEEAMMLRSGLDSRHIEYHRSLHHSFLREVRSIYDCFSEGSPESAGSLLEFLISWLAYHILCVDQNMARQIASIEAGVDSATAYSNQEKEEDSTTEPLLAALNRLFEQISVRNRQLVELNQTLETRVEERTRELYQLNRQLEEMALTDELTGLPNRRQMMARLETLWEEAKEKGTPLACLMIDADGFKEVNDTYGHDAGDVVLKELARQLTYPVRSDDIVCRLGGDEFTVLCPNTDQEGALQIAEQIRSEINALVVAAGRGQWCGSVSVGVAISHPSVADADALIKLADEGVYAAKEAGRNCVRSIASTHSGIVG